MSALARWRACYDCKICYCATKNNKHRKTLHAVFAKPTQKTLAWSAIESLLVAVGCEVIEGDGSRVRFVKNGYVSVYHRPHPGKEAKPYQVRDARQFLEDIGVEKP